MKTMNWQGYEKYGSHRLCEKFYREGTVSSALGPQRRLECEPLLINANICNMRKQLGKKRVKMLKDTNLWDIDKVTEEIKLLLLTPSYDTCAECKRND